jgi:transcriptional regulator with XRE-family HTH domain
MSNICKDLREALGYTVSQLAKQASMASPTINLIECGMPVSERTWVKLADFFKVTPKELKGETKLNVDRWLNEMTKEDALLKSGASEALMPAPINKPVELHQLNIKHVIKVTSAATNYYLDDGWIVLDTMCDKGVFYCLLGNKKRYPDEYFENLKKRTQTRPTSYWMGR